MLNILNDSFMLKGIEWVWRAMKTVKNRFPCF